MNQDKLLIFESGAYETGYWLHEGTYPDSTEPYYIVDCGTEEGAGLAAKIKQFHPYFTLHVVEGELVNVLPREKTQEEIDKENEPTPKTDEQLKIESLEAELRTARDEQAASNRVVKEQGDTLQQMLELLIETGVI
jgi:hypothetical protein